LIAHLKGLFHCNHRIREGGYRLLFEIHEADGGDEGEAEGSVWVFDADTRGQVYRG
jgi:mRNA-degrading endonuclease RelE of RelBE toxin-antitoxin system